MGTGDKGVGGAKGGVNGSEGGMISSGISFLFCLRLSSEVFSMLSKFV